MQRHLYKKEFVTGYINWTCHGENFSSYESTKVGDTNAYVDMVVDTVALRLNVHDDAAYTEEAPNKTAEKFYQLLRDADELLWDSCQNHTQLSAVSQLLNLKSEFLISESYFDRLLLLIKSMLPRDEKLPENYYRATKMINELGLGYVKIDACLNHCMLYYKTDVDKSTYFICHHDIFKPKRGGHSKKKRCTLYVIVLFSYYTQTTTDV